MAAGLQSSELARLWRMKSVERGGEAACVLLDEAPELADEKSQASDGQTDNAQKAI
jgi:hypothetical protein